MLLLKPAQTCHAVVFSRIFFNHLTGGNLVVCKEVLIWTSSVQTFDISPISLGNPRRVLCRCPWLYCLLQNLNFSWFDSINSNQNTSFVRHVLMWWFCWSLEMYTQVAPVGFNTERDQHTPILLCKNLACSSSSIPNHSPVANSVTPKNFTVPISWPGETGGLVRTTCPMFGIPTPLAIYGVWHIYVLDIFEFCLEGRDGVAIDMASRCQDLVK